MKAEAAPTGRLRRWWRWLWRLALAGCVLAALLGWWAWQERVRLVNAALLRVGGDTRVQIAGLEWDDGLLHVRDVSALHLPTNQRVGEAGHVEWRPTLEQLWNKNLGSVRVEGGSMDATLALFATQEGAAGSAMTVQPWRLETLDLASTKIVLRDDKHQPLFSVTVQGSVRGGSTAISFESTSVDAADLAWQGRTISSRFHMDAVMNGGRIEIKKASLQDGHFDLAWMKGLYPLLEGGVDLQWEGKDIVIARDGGLVQGGRHDLRLKNLRLQPANGPGSLKVAEADLKVSQQPDGRWQVARGTVLRPEVEWTQELEAMLSAKAEARAETAQPPPPAAPWKAWVEALEVKDGRVTLTPTARNPLAGAFQWNATLKALEISSADVRSAAPQRLEVLGVSLRWGRLEEGTPFAPFVSAHSAAAEVVPDRLRTTWEVQSLVMENLRVELTPENGPWFRPEVHGPPVPVPAAPEPVAAATPWWQHLRFGDLQVKNASYVMALELAERVEISTRFDIVTENARQRLRLVGARALVPKRASLPVTGLEKVEVVAVLPDVWQNRRVVSLKVEAGHVDVGEALMSLFAGPEAATATEAEKEAERAAARWMADKLDVSNLGVTILNLAPGLPPVRFEVNSSAKNTPLDLNGLAENVAPQRIVLKNLRIPSPHEPLRTVAEMDVIHVSYTLDGLLRRRIDRVEILSPLLYVGEDLFWYVENYRKFMDGEAPPADPGEGPPLPPKPTAPGWRVDTLAVSDGRLLLAPKGVPIAGFSRPFPFSFTSRLESGQLDAVFDIPTDDYTLKDLKLEFRQMKGQVRFNLPMKDRNNNLTETFTVEQLRWKELHMEKAHLSVTYDANGIYGQFGGRAYGGYVNGAFDVYLDDVYTWDGWISGVDVALGPVTKALFPTYFLLEGGATGKVIATGNMHELYQGDLELKGARGKFNIESLNDLIKDLPPALQGDISQQIRRIGLETLRHFEYDDMDGKARFYGREGRGHLRFTGPLGARKIDVNVYDHRWKEEPRKSATAEAGTVVP